MTPVSANDARDNLLQLIDETAASHEPLLIAGERHSAVLIAAEDWAAIQETLHLLSIPGIRESIREGLATSIEDCSSEPVFAGDRCSPSLRYTEVEECWKGRPHADRPTA